MYTVKSVMTQLTDPEVVLQNVSETLRKIDPEFAKEERQYFQTVDALEAAIGDSISPSVSEYIAAEEQKICAEILHASKTRSILCSSKWTTRTSIESKACIPFQRYERPCRPLTLSMKFCESFRRSDGV